VSGDLSIRGDHDLAASRIATTSGDVRLEGRISGPGPFSIETVSGDMILAPTGGVRLEVKTVTGDVRSAVPSASEGGRGARTVVVRGGGATLSIRSISGDVRVVDPNPSERSTVVSEVSMTPPTPHVPEPPRPPDPPQPPPVAGPEGSRGDEPRSATTGAPTDSLAVLEALERGEIEVDEASRRLEALDSASPEPAA
jgi:hypothetical protein